MAAEWLWLEPSWQDGSSGWGSGGGSSRSSNEGTRDCCCQPSDHTDSTSEPKEVTVVKTRFGPIHVTIVGDRSKLPLITYHDIGINHALCFGPLMHCPDTAPMLRHHFCFFHVDAPGHQEGARHLRGSASHYTAQDMADQVADVINSLGLVDVTCMGVTAGAYILTLLALRHPCLVRSLILVSPLCRPPSWAEWAASKVLVSSLSLVGAASTVASAALMQRYVPLARTKPNQRPSSPQLTAIQEGMRGMAADAMVQYIKIMGQRRDLTGLLSGMRCPCLVVVGELSPFRDDALHLRAHLPRGLAAWFQVPASGSVTTRDCPHRLLDPLHKFLSSCGYCLSCPSCAPPCTPPDSTAPTPLYASPSLSSPCSSVSSLSSSSCCCSCLCSLSSPRTPLAPTFRPEDLSLAAQGSRLKPIRTKWDGRGMSSRGGGGDARGGCTGGAVCGGDRPQFAWC
ncbi:hypothetical protein CLOM_g23486 [Closterium sp. NIES-68]|nr:hypothetical protein CLOM_g23486 [Closterium sp. NIES-68]GJP82911.1 hypothetical protein CLOP_g13132 [Closterium sp. NIES-67]